MVFLPVHKEDSTKMSTYRSRQNTALPPSPQSQDLLVPNPKLRLREQVREVMRFKHYSVLALDGVGPRQPIAHKRVLHIPCLQEGLWLDFRPRKLTHSIPRNLSPHS